MKSFILPTILHYFVLNKLSNVRAIITAGIHGRDFSRVKIVLLVRQAFRIQICESKINLIAYVTKCVLSGRHFIYYICSVPEFVRCVLSE